MKEKDDMVSLGDVMSFIEKFRDEGGQFGDLPHALRHELATETAWVIEDDECECVMDEQPCYSCFWGPDAE